MNNRAKRDDSLLTKIRLNAGKNKQRATKSKKKEKLENIKKENIKTTSI